MNKKELQEAIDFAYKKLSDEVIVDRVDFARGFKSAVEMFKADAEKQKVLCDRTFIIAE